jgi:integrative and conjugative element protein (TIGR02256 family)
VTLRLNVTQEARAAIRQLAQLSEDGLETGGILLGRGPSDHGLIDVIEAGDPGPRARREPTTFLRDLDHARKLADAAWERSRAAWIGEWHTHPEARPEPSACDLVTYAQLLDDATLKFAVFVSIIVTPRDSSGWADATLTPWLIGRKKRRDVIVVGRL